MLNIGSEESSDGPTLISPLVGEYKLFKRRWLMLVLYCVVVLEITTFQFTYAAVQNIALAYYAVGTFEMNMMINVIYILFVPFSFISSWLLDRKGLYVSFVVGVVTCAVGAWIRYVGAFVGGPQRFWVAFGGQILIGMAQPFMGMNCITLLAANWFGEKERTIAVSIAGLFNVIGMPCYSCFPPHINAL